MITAWLATALRSAAPRDTARHSTERQTFKCAGVCHNASPLKHVSGRLSYKRA